MAIRPLYERVLVRATDKSQTTASGIVLAAKSQDTPDEGEVIAVGEGHMLTDGSIRPLTVNVGDTVLFDLRTSGRKIKVDGEEILVFSEGELIGILD